MKILYLIGNLSGGGKERRLVQLIKGIKHEIDSSVEIALLCLDNRIDYPEIKALCNDITDAAGSQLRLCSLFENKVKSFNPDVVHLWMSNPIILVKAVQLHKKYAFKLIDGHIVDSNVPTKLSRKIANHIIFNAADAVISNSAAGLRAKGADNPNALVIRNGFDPARLLTAKRSDDFSGDRPLVVMAARVEPAKDFKMFVSVASRLPEADFLAVGKGPMLDKFLNAELPSNIKFIGFRSDVESIFASSSAVCLFTDPCIHAEGISNSIMEAMALSKVVVATRGGGTTEIITDGKDGFIIEPGDVDTAVLRLRAILNDRKCAELMGEAASKKITDEFSLSSMCSKYMNIYQCHPVIEKKISDSILMVGEYYLHSARGGMAAVIQYYSKYFETLKYVPYFRHGSKIAKMFWIASGYLRTMFRLVFDRSIRLVHVHSASGASFSRSALIIRLANFFSKKTILHIHGARFREFYEQGDSKHILAQLCAADSIVVLSDYWMKWFTSIGVPQDKLIVLHNITSFPDIRKSREALPEKPLEMLFMGELLERKGVYDILNAISSNIDFFRGRLHFVIGGYKGEEQIIKTIEDKKLSELVEFYGWISGEDKVRVFNNADVFILPSFNEGLPISILEAMSYSNAIITTPVGGIPEVVENGVNGILVSPGNVNEIADAIKSLVVDRQKALAYGKKGYQKVLSYLPDRVMKDLRQLYISILTN